MKILVCISSVPDTTSRIQFRENNTSFDSTGVQYVINPNDEFGLTKAIYFKEIMNASVTVITVGEADVEPILRKALAIGADDAIRVNLKPEDGFSVAKELCEVVQKNQFDLIIAGRESIDYNGGTVPGVLAALLGFDFVNNCIGLELDGGKAKATRETDGGKETIETTLPIVIASQKGLVEEADLKIPNIRGIMSARQKPLQVLESTLPKEPKTLIQKFELPPQKGTVKLIDKNNLDELVELLRNEANVI